MPAQYGFSLAATAGYSIMPPPPISVPYPYAQNGVPHLMQPYTQNGRASQLDSNYRSHGGQRSWSRGGGSRNSHKHSSIHRHNSGKRGSSRTGHVSTGSDSSGTRSSRRPRGAGGARRSARSSSKFAIDIQAIKSGGEKRTTVMVRNIPNRYVRETLLEDMSAFLGRFDFFYLPMDLSAHSNVGYAFINFASGEDLIDFYNAFHEEKWPRHKSKKICAVAFGRLQGKKELISQFQERTSKVSMPEDYQPLCFYTEGPNRGQSYSALK